MSQNSTPNENALMAQLLSLITQQQQKMSQIPPQQPSLLSTAQMMTPSTSSFPLQANLFADHQSADKVSQYNLTQQLLLQQILLQQLSLSGVNMNNQNIFLPQNSNVTNTSTSALDLFLQSMTGLKPNSARSPLMNNGISQTNDNQLVSQLMQQPFLNTAINSANNLNFLTTLLSLSNTANGNQQANNLPLNLNTSQKRNFDILNERKSTSPASQTLREEAKRQRKNSETASPLSNEEGKGTSKNVTIIDSIYQLPLKIGWKRETIVKGIGPAGIYGDVSYVTPCGKRLWKIETVFDHLKTNNYENQLTVEAFNFKSTFRLGTYFECNNSSAFASQSLVEMSEEKVDNLLSTSYPQLKTTQDNQNSRGFNQQKSFFESIMLNRAEKNDNNNSQNNDDKQNLETLKNLTDPVKVEQVGNEMIKFFKNLINEQKTFEETYEKEREKYFETERDKYLKSCIEQGISKELKNQVDDLCLLNSQKLPDFDAISGMKMSPKMFGECVSVMEFLYSFCDSFAIDKETIPTLSTMQRAFMDRDENALDCIIHLLIELTRFALLEAGPSEQRLFTMATGTKLTNLDITTENISLILRIIIIGRNGHENEMSDWLSEEQSDADEASSNGNDRNDETKITFDSKDFRSLDGEKQSSILYFISDELICNSRIVQVEIDKTMEVHLNLKRDKWNIESKVKRLKMILNRKCLGPSLMPVNEGNEEGELDSGERDKLLVSLGWNMNKPILAQNTLQLSEIEMDMPPSDDEESIDLGDLENRIKKLQSFAEAKQKLIDESMFKLWGCHLGQDRYKRNYFVFGSVGGLYLEGPKCHDENDSGFNVEDIVGEIEKTRTLNKTRNIMNLISGKAYKPAEKKVERPAKVDEPVNSSPSPLPVSSVKKEDEEAKVEAKVEAKTVLSERPVKGEAGAKGKKQKIDLSPEDQSKLCDRHGIDDTILTTAALLYITQNQITDTTGNLWQVIALEYKKILVRLLSDELQERNDSEEEGSADDNSLTNCLLHLSKWLKRNKNGSSNNFNVTHEELLESIKDENLDKLVRETLVTLSIQTSEMLKIEGEHFNCWKMSRQPGEEVLPDCMRSLACRGFRERNLLRNIRKYQDVILSSLKTDRVQFEEDSEDLFILVKTRRGKKAVRGNNNTSSLSNNSKAGSNASGDGTRGKYSRKLSLARKLAKLTGNNSNLSDPTYIDECNLIEEIENLEDRVISSRLQRKNWQASVRMLDDNTIFLISSKTERKSRIDQYPLDVAKSKLLQLRDNIEPRYLVADSLASCKSLTINMNDWIKSVHSATTAKEMRVLVNELLSIVAWHKSIMKVLCQICCKDSDEESLLLCDACDQGFHLYCFRPPLDSIPDGNWFCFDCQCKKSNEHLELCYICGNREGGKVQINDFKSTASSRRLTKCDSCQRCVHAECLNPPEAKLAKDWLCSGCTLGDGKEDRKRAAEKTKADLSTAKETATKKANISSNSTRKKDPAKVNKKANPEPAKKAKKNSHEETDRGKSTSSDVEEGPSKKSRDFEPPLWPENCEEFKLMNDEILDYCRLSTLKMSDHESSWPFRNPVDGKKIPMYKKVIKKPMDLSYVAKKCNNNSRIAYKRFKNWVDDIRQIFLNCEIFNEDDSEIGKAGHIMSTFFERSILDPKVLTPIFERCMNSDEEDEEDSEKEAKSDSEPPQTNSTDGSSTEQKSNRENKRKLCSKNITKTNTLSPPCLQETSLT